MLCLSGLDFLSKLKMKHFMQNCRGPSFAVRLLHQVTSHGCYNISLRLLLSLLWLLHSVSCAEGKSLTGIDLISCTELIVDPSMIVVGLYLG